MKKTKIKLDSLKPDWEVPPMRYYFCINCGHLDDFGFLRHRKIKCRECGYDDLCKLDKGEYDEETSNA